MRWIERRKRPLAYMSGLCLDWHRVSILGMGCWRGRLTPSNSNLSSFCRGMTVTSSISHRNAISGGVKPGGSGNAMISTRVGVGALVVRSRVTQTRRSVFGSSQNKVRHFSMARCLLSPTHQNSHPSYAHCGELRKATMPSLSPTWVFPIALLASASVSRVWFTLVSKHVPEPYLVSFAESVETLVFTGLIEVRMRSSMFPKHKDIAGMTIAGIQKSQLRQACKSSTPNCSTSTSELETDRSRYLVSLLLNRVLGDCETSSLRILNAGAICFVFLLAYDILQTLHNRRSLIQNTRGHNDSIVKQEVMNDIHSALNISLFPPLLFFSGLYYTDTMSTLVVLLSYDVFLKSAKGKGSFRWNLSLVVIGVVALFFRQTNIFWVTVFPAGLAVVDALKTNSPKLTGAANRDALIILKRSWSEGHVFDCPVQDADLQGIHIDFNTLSRIDIDTHKTILYSLYLPVSLPFTSLS